MATRAPSVSSVVLGWFFVLLLSIHIDLIRTVGIYLHLCLTIPGAWQVLFQLDTDKFPLLSLLRQFCRGRCPMLLRVCLPEKRQVLIMNVVGLCPYRRTATILLDLKPQFELLPFLRAAGRPWVHMPMVFLQINHKHFFQMLIFLLLTAALTYSWARLLGPIGTLESVIPHTWLLVSVFNCLAYLPFLLAQMRGL